MYGYFSVLQNGIVNESEQILTGGFVWLNVRPQPMPDADAPRELSRRLEVAQG